jgi:xanthine dehydrogenase YagS FAD-binding subunit
MEVLMNKFDYRQAANTNEASALVADNTQATFVAGGTNLIDLWKYNVTNPTLLVDINHISENKTIEEIEGGGIRLGALVSNADTAYHPLIEQRYPLISRSILAGASGQIRNMATNGGNLMQRTRCYYFYDSEVPCNKRNPGSGCPAINGYNRMHAILGHSDNCIAVFPSDMCVALAALEAVVNVSDANTKRSMPFEDFHRLPGKTPEVDNTLKRGEIITSIDLPSKGFSSNYSYLKIRDRNSYAFALVSVATGLELDGDTIREARIALGGVAHKPWRVKAAEDGLRGRPVSETSFARAADIILEGAQGFKYNQFKIELAKRAIIRNCMMALHPELQKPGAQP